MFILLLLPKRNICSAILPIFSENHNLNPCRYASKSHPKPSNLIIVDYLVATFGFSPQQAAKVSNPVAHLKSPDKPQAVRRFLNQEGFSDAHVKNLITLHPKLLYASPEDTLGPNLRDLRDIGLSTSTLTEIILSSPAVLQINSATPRIKFWRDFFQGDDESLVKAFKQNTGLGNLDISRSISPKISLLRSHGLCIHDIQRIVLLAPRFITGSISSLEESLKRAEEFGFKPESAMFVHGLHAMIAISREVLQKRMELLKSFGWSEDEFIVALHKAPNMIKLTENHLRTKMNFLIGEAKCDPSDIASCPVVLNLSLEKRLRPRLHVLHLLESKSLSRKRPSFSTDLKLTNTQFVERYVLPHKKEITGLLEAYLAAIA